MTELPDRLLRDALRPGPPPAPDACADADALAAWSDGTMSAAERAAFEIHAAGCARCQALMAAMARTEPPPIEAPAWRRALFTWVMPLAAVTAAVVIVVSLSTMGRRVPAPQIARNEPAGAVAPPVSAPDDLVQPKIAAPAVQDSRHRREAGGAPAARPQDRAKDAAGRTAAKTERGRQDANTPAAPTAAQAPAPSAPPPSAAPSTAAPAVAAPAPAVPPTPAPATAERAAPAPAPPGLAGAGNSADAARFRVGSRDEAQLTMKAASAVPLLIASPARDSQWRISGRAIAYSDDGGATWQTQALDVDVPVRAGASPAPRVCWLAGARGLVLLTTDAVHWRRIAFPVAVDLTAIEATDASHATVTTGTGRRFGTSDGGATWTPR